MQRSVQDFLWAAKRFKKARSPGIDAIPPSVPTLSESARGMRRDVKQKVGTYGMWEAT